MEAIIVMIIITTKQIRNNGTSGHVEQKAKQQIMVL